MKPGLRLQILLLLGALLVVGFVPLYFAIDGYIEVALSQARAQERRIIGEAIAASVLGSPLEPSGRGLERIFRDSVMPERVLGVAVYDSSGRRVRVVGAQDVSSFFPEAVTRVAPAFEERRVAGRSIAFVTGADGWSVATALKQRELKASLLTRMLALYMALIGVLLMAAAYLTLTRWIIAPITQLSKAAQRVAATTRQLELPETRSRELSELSESLKVMTERLLREEQALRSKIAEVEHATGQLSATQAQLVRSERMASVGQLSAGLAHEIGNPIAAMIGLQDLILSGDLTAEEQEDFVRRMRKETERINRILRDLLDFARPATSIHEHSDSGSVEVSINETATLLLPQPLLRNVEVVLDVHPDLPVVRLPQGQITQVLLNLLLNSAAACQAGGTIRVTARSAQHDVELIVADDGPGVLPELGDRIFEPFVSSKDVGEGSGLGLSVCRGLVESVGGSIALDRGSEKGARFIVRLPKA